MLNKNQIKIIQNYFKKQPVAAVYLYGSKARGDDRNTSDIDLAVVFKKGDFNTFKLQGQFTEELFHLLKVKVDVQNLTACDIAFIYRVIYEGINIYNKEKELQDDFKIEIIRRYFDLKLLYDQYFYELSQRVKTGNLIL